MCAPDAIVIWCTVAVKVYHMIMCYTHTFSSLTVLLMCYIVLANIWLLYAVYGAHAVDLLLISYS